MNLPEWYGGCTDSETGAGTRGGRNLLFARRALASIGETLASELGGVNRVESWLSRIEPRAKILGILMLVVAVTLLKSLLSLSVVFGLALALALSSRLAPQRLARLWLGVPLFSAAIILPAVLNVVTPGTPVLTLWRFGEDARVGVWHLPTALTVTHAGLVIAARFIIRSVDCITMTALLVSSTDPSLLVSSLRRLGMPKVFGMMLAMMQRYMSLVLRTAEEIHLAKLSRTISSTRIRSEQRWVAAGIGVLFGRTYRLAEEVQQAMVSRGYDGDLQVMRVPGLRRADFVWIVGVVMVTAAVLLIDYLL